MVEAAEQHSQTGAPVTSGSEPTAAAGLELQGAAIMAGVVLAMQVAGVQQPMAAIGVVGQATAGRMEAAVVLVVLLLLGVIRGTVAEVVGAGSTASGMTSIMMMKIS